MFCGECGLASGMLAEKRFGSQVYEHVLLQVRLLRELLSTSGTVKNDVTFLGREEGNGW